MTLTHEQSPISRGFHRLNVTNLGVYFHNADVVDELFAVMLLKVGLETDGWDRDVVDHIALIIFWWDSTITAATA